MNSSQQSSAEQPWSVFAGPLDNIRKAADITKDSRTVQRFEDVAVDTASFAESGTLSELDFPIPENAAQGRQLMDALMKLSKHSQRLTSDLLSGAPPLAQAQRRELESVRHKLVMLLADGGAVLADKISFTKAGEVTTLRRDRFVFFGLLQCMCCIAHDPPTASLLAKLSCANSEALKPLVQQRLVPESTAALEFSKYQLSDVVAALKWLESKWLTMPYVESLPRYLDLLLARLSVLCIVPQTEHAMGSIVDYRRPLGDGLFTHTQRLLEDCCWTFGPMYKKLLIYARACSRREASVLVPKAAAKRMQQTVTDSALEMNNKDLIGLFFKTYMRCALRPSERQKYVRDYPSKPVSAPAVIEKMRGTDSKRRVMEHLARAPWIIVREQLFDRTTTDLLYILLIDSFVSNITGLRWMNTFVEFNVQLQKQRSVSDYLDRTYPRLVQDFNNFNLLHQGVLYVHNGAAKSYIHWLDIMLKPPFNGRFQSKSLDLLTKYTPLLEKAS